MTAMKQDPASSPCTLILSDKLQKKQIYYYLIKELLVLLHII